MEDFYMTKKKTTRNWDDIFTGQQQSGLSIAAYCKTQALSPATFYKQKKLHNQKPAFAEITLASPNKDSKIIFMLNGNNLEFEQTITFENLSKVLLALLHD
jgi:Na+-translocating ferredoxin:NAD+ oxidoreductase RnfD subunit